MKISLIINNSKNKRYSFGATSKFQDGKITYVVNTNDDTGDFVDMKKIVNSKTSKVKSNVTDFCKHIHRVGLLSEFIPLYKKYHSSNLTKILDGVNQKLTSSELSEFIRFSNLNEHKTLFYYLLKDNIINSIRNSRFDKLTIGELKKIKPQTKAQIQTHVNEFGISHTTGGISGFHDAKICNLIYNIASQNIGQQIYITDLVNLGNKKGLSVFAKMEENRPNILILGVMNEEEILYARKKINSDECDDFSQYCVEKTVDEKGNDDYKSYLSFPYSNDENNDTRKIIESAFSYRDEHGKLPLFGVNNMTLKIGQVKLKTTLFNDKNSDPDRICFKINYKGVNYNGFIHRLRTIENTSYYKNIYCDSPYKYLKEQLGDNLLINSEKEFWRTFFETKYDTKKIDRDYPNGYSQIVNFDLNYENIKEKEPGKNACVEYLIDKELYVIERRKQPNEINTLRYAYGFTSGAGITQKRKTIVSKDIIEEVLTKISDFNFNAAYKIDKSGKIFSYFKYKDIYFKLILSNCSNSTCFPMIKEDLEAEIGNEINKVPNL